MANRFRSPRPIQRSKRAFDWIGGVNVAFAGGTLLGPGAAAIISSIDTRVTNISAPFTVVRVRGFLSVVTDQVGAAEQPHGAFGMCIVNGEAFDAGIASIITPFTESFDDRWFYHTYWSTEVQPNAGGTGLTFAAFQHVIDGKAMRKVEFGDVCVAVIENGDTVSSALFTTNHRTGVKLH